MAKSVKSQRNKYRAIEYGCFAGEFVAVATPFVAIGIANYEKYFVEYDGAKMSIAFFMAMAVMGMAIYLISKKKLENSYITLLIGWAIMAFVFQMLGAMITDLATIMWFGLIGLCGAYCLELGSKFAKKKKDACIEAMKQADKEDLVEQYKEEKEEKKVKVKIKK